AEEARITVADGVVERAAHGVFQRAIPFLAIGFDEVVGRRAGRAADVARIDEHDDHDWNFFLGDQIVDDVERFVFSFAVDIAFAILNYEKSGWSLRIVLSGDVDPVIALHAVVDFAGGAESFRKRAGGEAR